MSRRWWLCLCVLAATTAPMHAQTPIVLTARAPAPTVGQLVVYNSHAENARPQAIPYKPTPGDILLYDDYNKFFHMIFRWADTAPPTHASMVIEGADGKPALLELTGPKVITARVQIMDPEVRLNSYPGMILVRKIREPLTPEQSRDLTQFAYAQEGKAFALPRVVLMVTPFCPRTGLRKELFGNTYFDRKRWVCSELVVAACATAKLLDGKKCCANSVYPRDLAVDERLNLAGTHHAPVLWNPNAAPAPVTPAYVGR